MYYNVFLNQLINMKKHYPVIIPVIIFMIVSFRCLSVPAVYLDAVNPDYLVTRMLNPHSLQNNVAWIIPGNLKWSIFPILIQVYHGALPLYLGLPFYAVFGTDIYGIRLTAMMFGIMVIYSLYLCLKRLNIKSYIILLGLLSIALDPTFIFAFRTQFYITLLPIIFIMLSIFFLLESCYKNNVYKYYLLSGLSLALACYGYFVYFSFLPVIIFFFIYAVSKYNVYHQSSLLSKMRACQYFFGGLSGGLILYIWGWLSAIKILGWADFYKWCNRTKPLDSHISLYSRIEHMIALCHGVIDSSAISMYIFGKNIIDFYLYNNVIILLVGILLLLLYIIFTYKSAFTNFKYLSFFCFFSLLIAPLILNLIFANKLGYHHLVMIIPIAYSIFIAAMDQINFTQQKLNKIIVVTVFINLISVNLMHDNSFFYFLNMEGGVGKYASVLTQFTQQNLKNDYYIMPDWGISLPYQLMTSGYIKVDTDFQADNINKFYLQKKSVNLILLNDDHNAWVYDINNLLLSKPILKKYVGNGQIVNQYIWKSEVHI
jgi:hypothetical protein